MKGNRQGSLSRSITRRSDQNCKIILQILILQFCRQLVKKVQKDFFDKLKLPGEDSPGSLLYYSTVTDFARFLGLSTSQPRASAA